MGWLRQKVVRFLSDFNLISGYYRGIATIFVLHHVRSSPVGELPANDVFRVSPEFLEDFIVLLGDAGYHFMSIDDLYEALHSGEVVKKGVVFTLDDGYIDVFKEAYPIFKKYSVPFTVYITTSFLDRKGILWWYALENLALRSDELVVGGDRFICDTYAQKNNVLLELGKLVRSLRQEDLLCELNGLFGRYDVNWFYRNEELCMSWKDVELLSKEKLCTIGNHTVNHLVFSKLSEDEIVAEVMDANRIIEHRIGRKVKHFAYPFGGREEVGVRETEILGELGFRTVVTARWGNIYPEHKRYCGCCLPRITLTEGFKVGDISKFRRRRIVTV